MTWKPSATKDDLARWKRQEVSPPMKITRVIIEGEIAGKRVKFEATEHYIGLAEFHKRAMEEQAYLENDAALVALHAGAKDGIGAIIRARCADVQIREGTQDRGASLSPREQGLMIGSQAVGLAYQEKNRGWAPQSD